MPALRRGHPSAERILPEGTRLESFRAAYTAHHIRAGPVRRVARVASLFALDLDARLSAGAFAGSRSLDAVADVKNLVQVLARLLQLDQRRLLRCERVARQQRRQDRLVARQREGVRVR